MRVLIVDDDKDCLNDIVDSLEPLNYECVKETSPVKAVDLYKMNPFDVVISDIRMPEMSGIDLLKNIKEIDKDAKIIIITGFGDLDTAIQAINNHAYAFFGKPINFKELVETLRAIKNEINTTNKINVNFDKLKLEYSELKETYDKLLDLVKKMKGDKS